MMRRSHLGLLAGAAAAMSLGQIMIAPSRPSTKDAALDAEKTGRQRKRWLQRQARKQTRKYRK